MVCVRLPGQLNDRRRSNRILGSSSKVIPSNKEHPILIDDREVRFLYFLKWSHVIKKLYNSKYISDIYFTEYNNILG